MDTLQAAKDTPNAIVILSGEYAVSGQIWGAQDNVEDVTVQSNGAALRITANLTSPLFDISTVDNSDNKRQRNINFRGGLTITGNQRTYAGDVFCLKNGYQCSFDVNVTGVKGRVFHIDNWWDTYFSGRYIGCGDINTPTPIVTGKLH